MLPTRAFLSLAICLLPLSTAASLPSRDIDHLRERQLGGIVGTVTGTVSGLVQKVGLGSLLGRRDTGSGEGAPEDVAA